APVGKKIDAGRGATALADENGSFLWKAIPTGTYTFRKHYGTLDHREIEVTSTSTYEWKEPNYNALLVDIQDTTGHLATCGFQDNDLIIGADGTHFATLADAIEAEKRSYRAESSQTQWVVRRGTSTITIAC